jgi:hypothetical protein
MHDTLDTPNADLAANALRLGRTGMGRREIAAELGLMLVEVESLAAEDAGFALALERAEEAARAWWEALPREAMSVGKPFNLAAWRDAMRARFGAETVQEDEPEPSEPRSTFRIPWNRRGPMGPNEYIAEGDDGDPDDYDHTYDD